MRIERVIKSGVKPVGCRVACAAVLRQAELCVRRIGRAEEVRAVASIARGRSSLKNIVDVAGCAGQRCVHSGQRIAGVLQVIELGSKPTVHGVAGLAVGRESRGYVIENRSTKVLLMAGVAGGGETFELSGAGALVALITFHQGMRPN